MGPWDPGSYGQLMSAEAHPGDKSVFLISEKPIVRRLALKCKADLLNMQQFQSFMRDAGNADPP